MKFCHLFYDYLYIDNSDGGICLCPWMDPKNSCIGNLLHDKVEDAYNGDYANYLRSTMDDQTFKFCRPEACPYIQNNELEEITPEEYEKRKKNFYYPAEINMAYDFVCNQSCETCRKSVFIPPAGYGEQMSTIQQKLEPHLDKAKRITASGHGDPFASKYMMSVLENLHPSDPDASFLLETNGVFFDEEHWERIKHLGQFRIELVVTINSFDPFIYRHISRGGNYEKMIHNLDFMSQLRKNGEIAHLTNTLVIQDRNFREIPSFIKRSFQEYAFDQVILRPVYQWGTMDEEVYWFKDVLNPCHPYHEEYLEILKDPALDDPRVYNFGGDTEHVARPYPAKERIDLLPAKVLPGSRIVVYGAGQVGQALVHKLGETGYCNVVLWIDQCFDNKCILSPNSLLNMSPQDYDYIVLATKNPFFAEEMRTNLIDMKISEKNIISCS